MQKKNSKIFVNSDRRKIPIVDFLLILSSYFERDA
jgi:hypothetical protein